MRVLFVGEDIEKAEAISRALGANVSFTVAADARAAAEAARAGRPDSILVDAPSQSLESTLGALRSDGILGEAAILALIGDLDGPSAALALEAGADDFLAKDAPAREIGLRIAARSRARRPARVANGDGLKAAVGRGARAEEALRVSEERFRLATEALRGVIYDWDLIEGSIWRSSGLVHIIGHQPDEVEPRAGWWHERVHPEDRPRIEALSSYASSVFDLEYRILHKDGHYVWVWDHSRLIRDGEGKPVRMLGFAINLDERKRIEQALRDSEERFRAMADTVPDILFASSMDGRCHYTNQRFYEYTGFALGEAEGYGWIEAIHPEDREHARRRWMECVSARRPLGTEYRMRGRDGSYRWFYARAQAIVSERSGIDRWFGATVDVHDLKMAEEALRASEEHLRLATEAGEIGTFSYEVASRLLRWSETARRILGMPADVEPSLDAWFSPVHPDDRASIEAAVRGAMEAGGAHRHQYRIVRPDGEVRWVEATARMTLGEAGQPRMLFGVFHDVTDRMRLEMERDALLDSERAARGEAERANRMKDEFIAVMSHELRTPLNAILGFTQMLRRGTLPPERHPSALEAVERNATLLARLISDVLDMGRIRAGKMKLDSVETDLASAVDAAIETQRAAAGGRRVFIERTGDASDVWVVGDQARLQQVVWNLLTNAVKFTKPGRRVEVSLKKEARGAVLTVRDEGEGIRPEVLPYLFEPFRQADEAAARRHGGLGLGLSIVKQIVELHEGSVSADSGGEGRGATFTVVIPLAQRDVALEVREGRAAPERAERGRAFEGLRVLVVDDEPDARELTRRLLEEEGADAQTVASVADALGVVRTGWPNVLISDLGMPVEDGFHLIRVLRGDERSRALPVIAVTAFTREEDRARAESAGFDGHVPKPVDPHRLFEVLARVTKSAQPTS